MSDEKVKRTVFIPGRTGFIGNMLKDHLLHRKGHRPIPVYRWEMEEWLCHWAKLTKKHDNTKRIVVVNCIRPDSMYAAMKTSLQIKRAGLQIIHLSSYDVDRRIRPLSKYSIRKRIQDWILKDAAIIVRLPNVWGYGYFIWTQEMREKESYVWPSSITEGCVLDTWIRLKSQGLSLELHRSRGLFDFVHVSDVASMLVSLIEKVDLGKVLIRVGSVFSQSLHKGRVDGLSLKYWHALMESNAPEEVHLTQVDQKWYNFAHRAYIDVPVYPTQSVFERQTVVHILRDPVEVFTDGESGHSS